MGHSVSASCKLCITGREMGHGSSVPREQSLLRIENLELQEGSCLLRGDASLRLAFVIYIKSGEWLDQIGVTSHEEVCKLDSIILPGQQGSTKELLSTYRTTQSDVSNISALSTIQSLTRSVSLSMSMPASPPKIPKNTFESYFSIKDSPCFTEEEFMALLFQILYPVYLSSPQHGRYLKYGIEHGRGLRDEDDESQMSHPVGASMVGTSSHSISPQSKRLQDILLGCAAHFDQYVFDKCLCEEEWLKRLTSAVDNHAFAFSVVDAHLCRGRIVYSNKAFRAMTEYTMDELLQVNLNVLNGPNTEISQLLLLQDAMKPMHTAKLGITFYTKSKRAFTDLVAVKTTTSSSVAVHFPAVQGANLDQLKQVDDLLILVSALFQLPRVDSSASTPAQPTWLPATLANLLNHVPSPRFLRSTSTTSGNGMGRGGGSVGGGSGSGGRAGGESDGGSANNSSRIRSFLTPRSTYSRGSVNSVHSGSRRFSANIDATEELAVAEES